MLCVLHWSDIAAVPFMFALLMLTYLAGQLIFHFITVVRTGTPPGPIGNMRMFALMIIGLVLSLQRRTVRSKCRRRTESS